MKVASWFASTGRADDAAIEDPVRLDPLCDVIAQGILILDDNARVIAANRPAGLLLRCSTLPGTDLRRLLKPLASEHILATILASLADRSAVAAEERGPARHSHDVELRLPEPDGTSTTVCYRFDVQFSPDPPAQPHRLLLIADRTDAAHQAREVADLRAELQVHGEILRALLRLGGTRFAAAVRKTAEAMEQIDAVLKKPAREQAAFRDKLDQTLEQVDRIRREAVVLRLTSLEIAARSFEDALHELRSREALSGGEFLPLAVKLDDLFGRLSLLRTLTRSALPSSRADDARALTDNGTQIIDAPRFLVDGGAAAADGALPARSPGSLASTLTSLTEHIAAEQAKPATLELIGIDAVPAAYQKAVKNVAIQLIRNAIVHGIEEPDARARAGKPATGALRLKVTASADGSVELRFQDDGRGIDPVRLRRSAVERGLLRPYEAAALSDRQAIKLIFKPGYANSQLQSDEPVSGGGLLLVRRYVDDAGGRIALASEPGRNTRFRVAFPPLHPTTAA